MTDPKRLQPLPICSYCEGKSRQRTLWQVGRRIYHSHCIPPAFRESVERVDNLESIIEWLENAYPRQLDEARKAVGYE